MVVARLHMPIACPRRRVGAAVWGLGSGVVAHSKNTVLARDTRQKEDVPRKTWECGGFVGKS